MKNQIKYGKLRYVSFIILDLLCLLLSNLSATFLYYGQYTFDKIFADFIPVFILTFAIDVFVSLTLNTLGNVLRRSKKKELKECVTHVSASFVLLAWLLFAIRYGIDYNSGIIYFTYLFDLMLLISGHLLWKYLLKSFCRKKGSVFLMTTNRFAEEGIEEIRKKGDEVSGVCLLENDNKKQIGDIPVFSDIKEALAFICWQNVDRVCIYGIDHQMVPDRLRSGCNALGVGIESVDFDYKILELKTIVNSDPKYGALSFLEGERDIPFPIRRVYWITETEADLHRGFHAHKLNCQLLFCPYGKIDIILDDGSGEKQTVTLDGPGKGLLLMPGLWREMVWRESGSVLCVLASEYYDEKEYIRNYDDFITYRKENQ